MTETTDPSLEKLKYRLNLILIALLCSTTLAPCVIFYVRGAGQFTWLLVFIGISYLVSRLPKASYDRLQLSSNPAIYKKLGVAKFKTLSTNGDVINRVIRKKYLTYRNVTNLNTIREKLNETYAIERSHTVLLVFCLLTTVYAAWTGSWGTATILFFGNLLFNYYPNLLQQYNRIQYKRVIETFG